MLATREQLGGEMTCRHSAGTLVCMSATEEKTFDLQSVALTTHNRQLATRLSIWLAPLLLLLAAFIVPTVSAKTLCVSHNRTGGNSTSAVQWCPAQCPRTGALDWEKLPGEYVPGGSGFANAARMAGQISADWAAENSGELGGVRPTYDVVAIATSGPVGDLGDAVVGKAAETVAPAAKGALSRIAGAVGEKISSLVGKAAGAIGKLFRRATEPELGVSEKKAIESYRTRILERRAKLDAYRKNPGAYDNQGLPKNAPSDAVRQRIVKGRIRHLKNEIKAFQGNIRKIEKGD